MQDIIHETQCFGPQSMYGSYLTADNLIIEKFENYQKRSVRNKYTILTSNGLHTLGIPLKKGKNNQKNITEVIISYDDNWVDVHLKTIRAAYGKSPFFDYYFDDIESILHKKYDFLFDLNMECLLNMLHKVNLQLNVKTSDFYQKTHHHLNDLRKSSQFSTTKYYHYTQVWAEKFDFIPNLSILDLLFCVGPESSSILKNISSQPNKCL